MSPRIRTVAREAAIFALYALLSILLTWPLARTLPTSVSDLGDPLLNAWILDWTSHALTHQPFSLFDAPMFVPSIMPLAYSEHLAGIAILTLPFHLAGLSPVTVYNLAMLLGFALSGYAAFVLARMFVPGFTAPFIAGIFYAFVSFKFDHLAHLQIVSGSVWVAFILAALVAWWRRPDWKRSALFTAAFVMNGLTNIYFLLFASAAVGFSLLFLFFAGEKRPWRVWLRMAAALLIAGLILLPFLQPYRVVSKTYSMKRPFEEVLAGSGDWNGWMRATTRSRLYGDLIPPDTNRHEHALFTGLMAIVLLACAITMTPRSPRNPATPQPRNPETGQPGIQATGHPGNQATARSIRILDAVILVLFLATLLGVMSEPRFVLRAFGRMLVAIRGSDVPMTALVIAILARLSLRMPAGFGGNEGRTLRDVIASSRFSAETWTAMLWMVMGVLGSLGLRTFFHSFLFQRIEPFQSMRAPGRWAIITYAGLAVWVALGASAVLLRRKGVRRAVAGAALVVLTIIDALPSIRWEQALTEQPPLYHWIKETRVAPVVEWPVDNWLAFRYLLGSTHHRLPLMNGSSGFEPPVYRAMRIAYEEKRYPDSLALAEQNGARILVVHAHFLYESDPQKIVDTIHAGLAQGRLQFLRRFDHGIEGDFVFAVTRNVPDWQRLRAPDVPDGAGHLPQHTLERFLARQPTYAHSTFGRLEEPHMHKHVTGNSLALHGWTISPHGIREVNVLLDEGRYRFAAERVPREEITRTYPWYYEGRPGFTLTIERPRNLPRETNVQIEVVDGRGKRTLFEDQMFVWEPAE